MVRTASANDHRESMHLLPAQRLFFFFFLGKVHIRQDQRAPPQGRDDAFGCHGELKLGWNDETLG